MFSPIGYCIMPMLNKRLLHTFVVATMMAMLGLVAGYLVARRIAFKVAENRLEEYAARIVADGEASNSELRTVLAAVNASPEAACSSKEIEYFRALIFESDYLKDAGRMRDGKIECSAAFGHLPKFNRQFQPDFIQQDGTVLYKDLAPYKKNDLTVITLQLGDSFVAFTPLTRMHLEPEPIHYTETVIDAPTQKAGVLLGELPGKSPSKLTTEGMTQVEDNLYVTRCSIRYFNCVTASVPILEIVRENRAKFIGCILAFGLFSGIAGMVFALLYRRNKSLEQQLRRAIRRDGLRLVYQPIVELAGGQIVGAEALLRWTDEDGAAVAPDVFVHIAEVRGFVNEITRLVVRHALDDFAETLRNNSNFRLSLNVAAGDLSDPNFLPMLAHALRRRGVSARSVVIEITEGSTAKNQMAIETILRLRELGHKVHIDDFGTGYSSLSYLKDLSVDAIKIDKAFTQSIGTGSVTVAILPQILALAEALDLGIVVEGIETRQQADYFASARRPVLAQGWLFGRPMASEAFPRRLKGVEWRKATTEARFSQASERDLQVTNGGASGNLEETCPAVSQEIG